MVVAKLMTLVARNLNGSNGSINAASVVAGALPDGMTATTQAASDNSTKLATTAYVDRLVPFPCLASGQWYQPLRNGAGAAPTAALTANRMYFMLAFCHTVPTGGIDVSIKVTGGAAAGKKIKAVLINPTTLAKIAESGDGDANAVAVCKVTISNNPAPGWYIFGVVSDGTPTVQIADPYGFEGGVFGVDLTNGNAQTGYGATQSALTYASIPATLTPVIDYTNAAAAWLTLQIANH